MKPPNQRLHRTGFPRHASCWRTWRATGTRPVRRIVRRKKENETQFQTRSPNAAVQSLGARVECMLHAVASFGAFIGVSLRMEVLMNLNVVMTSLVAGVALLRRSGDGSEIRRGEAWWHSIRNPRDRATEGSIPSLRINLRKGAR